MPARFPIPDTGRIGTVYQPLLFIILLITALTLGFDQGVHPHLTVVFYNVENLFDTIDDRHKNDNEFLPGSERRWTSDRYLHKIGNLARVLYAIDSSDLPAVIGLAEVENGVVLEDLTSLTALKGAPFEIILEEGEDPRGIDVALLYRTDRLKYLSHRPIPSSRSSRTRDILYVRLLTPAGDTLHIFVNHWKSRTGGVRETDSKRVENAGFLRAVIDSLFKLPAMPYILVMGDLNDEPCDESVAMMLGALPLSHQPAGRELYNLFYQSWEEGKGTLWYRDWDLFDQIIVSGAFLKAARKKGPVILPPFGYIFRPSWILDYSEHRAGIPSRSYQKGYKGGYSDHLPVYTVIEY